MLKVDTARMEAKITQLNEIAKQLDGIASRVSSVNRKLRWNTSISATTHTTLALTSGGISTLNRKVSGLAFALNSAVSQYIQAEKSAKSIAAGKDSLLDPYGSIVDTINFGEKAILVGPGGQLKPVTGEFKFDWTEWVKPGVNILQMLYKGGSTFDRYMKIGNAIGNDQALVKWFLNATDLKGIGKSWSTAKNPVTAFFNNFNNSSSPINKYFKETADDLIGKSGVGKAVASWAGIAADVFESGVNNWKEYKQSDGTMSELRMGAETVIEAGVDTIMGYALGAVAASAVAAGATAVGATVAVPALAITAVGGLIWTGVNAGVTAWTGKSATEHVSDFVCDTADKIGDAAKEAASAVGNWFKKLALT